MSNVATPKRANRWANHVPDVTRQLPNVPGTHQHRKKRCRADQEEKRLAIHDEAIDVPVAESRVRDRIALGHRQRGPEFRVGRSVNIVLGFSSASVWLTPALSRDGSLSRRRRLQTVSDSRQEIASSQRISKSSRNHDTLHWARDDW
jgi:hypothetical protein